MDDIKKLLEIANEAGMGDTVAPFANAIETLAEQQQLKLVVTGKRNIGKTTLINQMLEAEVYEPGQMLESDLPLRVSFKPLPDDDRYHCIFTYNRAWEAEDAILYEIPLEDVCADGKPTEIMNDKDIALVIVSAQAPMSGDEVAALKALAPLSRQVVLTGLWHVKEEQRSAVVAYVEKLNHSLGLPPLLVLEEDDPNIGKRVRSLLPAVLSWEALRKPHIDALAQTASSLLKARLENEIALNREKLQKSKSAQTEDNAAQYWQMLISKLGNMKEKATGAASGCIQSAAKSVVEQLVAEGDRSGFDAAWKNKFNKKLTDVVNAQKAELEKIILRDFRSIGTDLELLRPKGWEDAELDGSFACLCEDACIKLYTVQPNAKDDQGLDGMSLLTSISMGVVGAGVTGFAISPLVGVASGAAITGVMMALGSKGRKDDKRAQISKHIATVLKDTENMLADKVAKIYDKPLLRMRSSALRCQEGQRQDSDDVARCQDKEQKLNALLLACSGNTTDNKE